MAKINVKVDNNNFSELINRLEDSDSRIVIEQEGNALAALITYADLKRLETLEAILLKKAEQEEYEWLKAAVSNPAFDFLKDPEEDIYTLEMASLFMTQNGLNQLSAILSLSLQQTLKKAFIS